MPQPPPDYLVVGHLTRDLLPGGAVAPGGTAFYGALTAARLGYAAGMLTAAAGWSSVPAEVQVAAVPSAVSSSFAHSYVDGRREQLVHSVATRLTPEHLPDHWRAAPLVHLGPVIDECDLRLITAFPGALLGVTPQGWMRRLDGSLPAPMRPVLWRPEPALLRRIDLLVLSVEDIDGDTDLAAYYASHCPCVALTDGANGVTLYIVGEAQRVPASPAQPVDSNGAGDVFAAAMLLQLFETGDPLLAARFAAAAAAVAIEGNGASSIPTRAGVIRRMRG
jgi:sugar/nucleoside kinase (ribokinase family)